MPDIGGDSEWIRDKKISNHMLRRTARERADALERKEQSRRRRPFESKEEFDYRVESTIRGPWGWRVQRFVRRRGV